MHSRSISHFEYAEPPLGEGGAGVVYKARDLRLDRFVALKFLSPHLLGSQEAVRRFLREARAISALNHPHIATIHEVDERDGRLFLVLEYLPGGTLSSKIHDVRSAGQQLLLRRVLEWGLQIAGGLAYAHRHGIIHRDVKPANILFTEDQTIKVTDFGLAKFLGADSSGSGRLAGTVPYMSPEQVKGREADQRTDIYSFGVILYEMTTGERPFEGPHDAAILHAITHDPLPSLLRLRPDAPAELDRIVRRAMARDPDHRYQRVETLKGELVSVRDKYCPPVEERDTSTLDKTTVTTWTRHPFARVRLSKRVAASLAGMLLAVGTLATGAMLWPSRCLWAPGWFTPCEIPAHKHIGVLDFDTAGNGEDRTLVEGLRELLVTKLSRLANFDESLCVHRIDLPAEAVVVNLNLSARVESMGENTTIEAELWDPRNQLELRELPVEARIRDASSLQDNLALRLAGMLNLDLSDDARRAMAAGSTGIRDAFYAHLRGLGHLRAGETDEAISTFEEAIREDPFYASAYAGLAEAQRSRYHAAQDGRWMNMALESCQKAIERSRDDPLPEAYIVLGKIHYDMRRYEQAIEAFRRAVELNPIDLTTRNELVKAYVAMGNKEEAEAVSRMGLELRPNCWLAHDDLGDFYSADGRYEEAEPHYRRYVELAPQSPRAHNAFGIVSYDLQHWVEAEQAWRRASELQPNVLVYLNLGQLYLELDCARDAARALDRATALDETEYLAWGNKAEAYRRLPDLMGRAPGLFHEAIRQAERQRKDFPNDEQLLRMIAFYHARLGDKELAFREIREALRLNPHDVKTLYRAGFLYEVVGERDLAIHTLGEALERGRSAREVCTFPDFEGLRADPRFPQLFADKCEQYADPGASPSDGQAFVCPEDRPPG